MESRVVVAGLCLPFMSWIACDRPLTEADLVSSDDVFSLPPRDRLLLAWGLFFGALVIPFLVLCILQMLCWRRWSQEYEANDPEWQEQLGHANRAFSARQQQFSQSSAVVTNDSVMVDTAEVLRGPQKRPEGGEMAGASAPPQPSREAFKRECLAPLDDTPLDSADEMEMTTITSPFPTSLPTTTQKTPHSQLMNR